MYLSTVKVLISFRSLKRAGENTCKLFQPFERNLNLIFFKKPVISPMPYTVCFLSKCGFFKTSVLSFCVLYKLIQVDKACCASIRNYILQFKIHTNLKKKSQSTRPFLFVCLKMSFRETLLTVEYRKKKQYRNGWKRCEPLSGIRYFCCVWEDLIISTVWEIFYRLHFRFTSLGAWIKT